MDIIKLLAENTLKFWTDLDVLWPSKTLHKNSADKLIDYMKKEGIEELTGPEGWYLKSDGTFHNPFSIKDKKIGSIWDVDMKEVVFNRANPQLNPHSPYYNGEPVEVKQAKVIKELRPKENELVANTIMEFVNLVADIGTSTSTLWYRGQSSSFPPIPNIYRPDVYMKLSETFREHCDTHIIRLEKLQLEEFRAFAFPFLDYMPNNDQEWLILMQHFGLKTRLLDYSLDPLTALSFSIQLDEAASAQHLCTNDTKHGAVWLLDPLKLNKKEHGIYHLPNITSDKEYQKIPKQFYIGEDARYSGMGHNKKHPMAVIGALNNKRIISQSGVFLFYPQIDGMNDFENKCKVEEEFLTKIIIPSNKKADMRAQLRGMGYNKTKIYPEMKSVAEDITFRLTMQ